MRKVLILDCETGGLDPSKHGLTQLSAGVFEYADNWKLMGMAESVDCTCRPVPELEYQPEALEMQHRTMADLEAGIPVAEAVGSIRSLVRRHFGDAKRCAPVAQNAAFDKAFLDASVARHGLEHPTNHCWRCTMQLFRWMQDLGLHDSYRANLDSMLACFGIVVPESARHTSMGDVKATAMVLGRMMQTMSKQWGEPCEARR